jgi:hypothetical protein
VFVGPELHDQVVVVAADEFRPPPKALEARALLGGGVGVPQCRYTPIGAASTCPAGRVKAEEGGVS